MKQKLITLAGLLISGTILAQNGGTIMKKYEINCRRKAEAMCM